MPQSNPARAPQLMSLCSGAHACRGDGWIYSLDCADRIMSILICSNSLHCSFKYVWVFFFFVYSSYLNNALEKNQLLHLQTPTSVPLSQAFIQTRSLEYLKGKRIKLLENRRVSLQSWKSQSFLQKDTKITDYKSRG